MENQRDMRILSVDDEAIFHDILDTIFTVQGYRRNLRARSGAEALTLLRDPDRQFDCILLDIQMPGMDGIELCGHIRAMPKYATTPILMLTSMSEQGYIDQAFAAGASDYLTKPINEVELNARLRAAFHSINENQRIEALTWQVETTSVDKVGMRFADPINLPEVKDMMAYLAMQNFLLTLGNLRAHSWSAIGFQIVGGAQFFAATQPRDFLEMLQDVAISIRDGLKTHSYRLAYAGNGEFVALIDKSTPVDPDELQDRLMDLLEPFEEFHLAASGQTVQICVGEPCSNSLLTLAAATAPLDRALQSVRHKAALAGSAPIAATG